MKSPIQVETPEYTRELARFVELFNNIQDQSAEAGRLLVKLVKMNPDTLDIIEKRFGFARIALNRLYAVGCGKLDKRLVMMTSRAALRLVEMPVSVQQKALDLSVVKIRDHRTAEGYKLKPLNELTETEARRVFTPAGIVSPEKQTGITHKVVNVCRYKIEEDGVRVLHRNTLLTWDALRAMLTRHDQESLANLSKTMKDRQLVAKR